MTILPSHLLKLMSPEDRAKLGKAGLLPEECEKIAEAKSEKQLQQQIESLLRRSGLFPIRQRMDRKSNIQEGVPDIFFAAPCGEIEAFDKEMKPVQMTLYSAVAWEVKMPGKNPTLEQVKIHADMRAAGWMVDVIRSYDEARAALAVLATTIGGNPK